MSKIFNKRIKFFSLISLSLLIVLSLVVQGFSQGIVANEFVSPANEYWVAWNQGVREACDALGLEYREYTENLKGTSAIVANIEDAITAGAKIIVMTPSNESAIIPVSQLCEERGAFLVNSWHNVPWFTPLDSGDHFVAFLTPDNTNIGYQQAKLLFEEIKEGNVVMVSGIPGSGSSEDREKGVEIALKEYPNIKLLDTQPGYYERDRSRNVMEDFIVAYPSIDGIIAGNDDEAQGIIGAYLERGMKIPPIVGVDGTKEGFEAIIAGEQFGTIFTLPAWQGGIGVVLAYDAMNGYKPLVPERMMYTEAVTISVNNVEEYYETFFKAEKSPYDWAKMSKVLNPEDWDPQLGMSPIDPNEIWKNFTKPAGYELPEAYRSQAIEEEYKQVSELYKQHYKK
jgi:ribose transport system substrate-binding protein